MILRKHFGIAILGIVALGYPSTTVAMDSPSPDTRPNIILCMSDDQGWGDVGFNGHELLKTPAMDKMADEGIKFTRWYAAAPVCSPTRGSCLTGRHPFRYEIPFANTGHLKPEEICIQEILKEHGYRTGHFGKWHLGTLTTAIHDANRGAPGNTKDFSPPWKHGFDICFSTESKVPTYDPMQNPAAISKAIKKGVPEGGPYGTSYWTEKGERVEDKDLRGDDSMLIVQHALKFMKDSQSQDQPFFAVVWFHAPHLPVVADNQHLSLYPNHPFGLYGQHYAGCISAIDDAMAKLRQEMETAGIYDNTLLYYCSDNGPEGSSKNAPGSAGPFRGRKRSLYEGGVRVPAFATWPARIKTSKVCDLPCVTSDYLPTILELLELPLPDRTLDGISLKQLLEQESPQRKRPIGFQSKNMATWNSDRFKLVVTRVTGSDKSRKSKSKVTKRVELFDLLNDPGERRDLADQHPTIVKEFSQALEAWQASCKNSAQGADY